MIRNSAAKSFTKFETCTIGAELRQVNEAVGIILTLSDFLLSHFHSPLLTGKEGNDSHIFPPIFFFLLFFKLENDCLFCHTTV